MRHLILLLTFCVVLTGCSRVELASHFLKKGIKHAENSKSKGKYKVGSPYRIKGKKYYPEVDYDYNKKGIASWYGPGFHGKTTANGERYDQNALTAAHKTLPMPSIVRVTNLENGRSIIVRVNDRGPYADRRIIDMSKRGAELLGFKNQGIAKVRVKVLENESRHVAELAKAGKSTDGIEIAMNKKSYRVPKTEKPQNVQVVQTPRPIEPAKVHQAVISSPIQTNIFVQTGAFSTRDAAMRYSSALSDYGRAQIHPASVNGQTLYRVRFPALDLLSAAQLCDRLYSNGYQNALIVVD